MTGAEARWLRIRSEFCLTRDWNDIFNELYHSSPSFLNVGVPPYFDTMCLVSLSEDHICHGVSICMALIRRARYLIPQFHHAISDAFNLQALRICLAHVLFALLYACRPRCLKACTSPFFRALDFSSAGKSASRTPAYAFCVVRSSHTVPYRDVR